MRLSLAKFISIVFNPIVVCFFAPFLLVYRTTHDTELAIHWSLYTLIFIALLTGFAFVGVKKKIFSDLDVSKREQRSLMYLVSIICGCIFLLSLFFLDAPSILYFLIIGVILGVAFLSVVNRKIKASIHVASITALVLPVAVSFGQYYYLLLFLIPIVVWARLKTKRHTFSEILVGGTIGGVLSISLYIIAKFFLNR